MNCSVNTNCSNREIFPGINDTNVIPYAFEKTIAVSIASAFGLLSNGALLIFLIFSKHKQLFPRVTLFMNNLAIAGITVCGTSGPLNIVQVGLYFCDEY